MKISVAQTKPVKGDIEANIENHKKLIDLAISNGADTIIFPELSITGYEPALANELATTKEDKRLDDFQKISDDKQLTIGVGMPIKNNEGVVISMIIFQPNEAREIYAKKYLHADEELFFIPGENSGIAMKDKPKIGIAICYEISIPEHSKSASKNGVEIYIASVAKSVSGVDSAIETLSAIAKKYSMTVMMSNCVGYCDNFECGGRTSIWNNKGSVVTQLNDKDEGIVMIDTVTQEAIEKYLEPAASPT